MEHQLAQSAVTLLALLTTTLTPVSSSASPSTSLVYKEEVYVVKEGDSLASIAEKQYGKADFWTNIWNTNTSITSPHLLEKGRLLRIQKSDAVQVEKLDEILQKRLEAHVLSQSQIASGSGTVEPKDSNVLKERSHVGGPLTEEQLTYLGNCESGMTAARNSGNGYYGAFQFSIGTWNSMGSGYERADLAPLEVQKEAVQRLLSRSSIFTQFPGCARKMQAEGIL